ncbi:MAG: hypothetical protein ACTS6G_00660 [Candidatus Hodgkinia cicadicola]
MFVGPNTSIALGDYISGSNYVLPNLPPFVLAQNLTFQIQWKHHSSEHN